MDNNLILLEKLSNKYGSDSRYVLAGGGNTSYKTDDTLYVKGSGTSLATIKAEDFVRLDRKALSAMWDKTYSEIETERESEVLADMMSARKEGETRRPSVETLLHNLFPQRFILHVHPAEVNGMTCGKRGREIAKELFPDCVWVDACKPGYILAALCRDMMTEHKQNTQRDTELLFLQNHGVFFAGNSVERIEELVKEVMDKIGEYISKAVASKLEAYEETIKNLLGVRYIELLSGSDILAFDPSYNSPTPDHIVYCKANYLTIDMSACPVCIEKKIAEFELKNGYKPRVIIVKGQGAFVTGADEKQFNTVKNIFLDQVAVYKYSAAFGGYYEMPSELVDFIVNWEVESYRAKVQ